MRSCTLAILSALVLPGAAGAVQGQTTSALVMKGVSGNLELRSTITVEVDSLQLFLDDEERDAGKFVLYLDNRPLKGLTVRHVTGTDQLLFDLARSDDTRDTWNILLGSPIRKGFSSVVPVSVGYEGGPALQSSVRYSLRLMRPLGFWLFVAGFLLVLFLFVRAARRTEVIRDARGDVPVGKLPPYSLGKTQMALWFFLILASFLLIFLVTGDAPTVTESVLALMGISAATALGAIVVTNSKADETAKQTQVLVDERALLLNREAAIEALITGGNVAGQALADLQAEKQKNRVRIVRIDHALNQESAGFWKDILTDVDGISLHRFQIVIWTLVLGAIFLVKVYQSLGMPDFPPTLVALMGISAGTYIGFKFPEKQV